jgi:hypothetical protein
MMINQGTYRWSAKAAGLLHAPKDDRDAITVILG